MCLDSLVHYHTASYWVCIRHYHTGTGVPHTKLERAGKGRRWEKRRGGGERGGEEKKEEEEEGGEKIEERGERRKEKGRGGGKGRRKREGREVPGLLPLFLHTVSIKKSLCIYHTQVVEPNPQMPIPTQYPRHSEPQTRLPILSNYTKLKAQTSTTPHTHNWTVQNYIYKSPAAHAQLRWLGNPRQLETCRLVGY